MSAQPYAFNDTSLSGRANKPPGKETRLHQRFLNVYRLVERNQSLALTRKRVFHDARGQQFVAHFHFYFVA